MTYEIMDEFIVLKVVPEEKKNVLNIVGQVTDKNKCSSGGNGNCKGIELRYGNGPGGTIPVKYTGD